MFTVLDENEFRIDISSTQLRREAEAKDGFLK